MECLKWVACDAAVVSDCERYPMYKRCKLFYISQMTHVKNDILCLHI